MPVSTAVDEMAAPTATYSRGEQSYLVPDLTLVDSRGEPVPLRALLDRGMPTLLQFVFTTCTTICPIMGAAFADAQDELDALGSEHQLVSISIDPEHDVPGVLAAYARSLRATGQWRFLTGSVDDIAHVLAAFDASLPGGNRMYQQPLTYLRASAGGPWVRLQGLLGTAELVAEYRRVVHAGLSQ
jgi:protein SCO1/2